MVENPKKSNKTICDVIREKTDKLNWQKWANIGQVIITIAILITLVITLWTFRTQQIQFKIEKRPYLFMDIQEAHGFTQDAKLLIFGGNISYINTGSYPASDITTDYLVADNITNKNIDYKGWYSDTYGAFPDIKIVAPKSSAGPVVYTPSISQKAAFACVGVLVAYTGFEPDKKYWYKRLDIYNIKKDSSGKIEKFVLIASEADWDRNSKFKVPKLNIPTWNNYMLDSKKAPND